MNGIWQVSTGSCFQKHFQKHTFKSISASYGLTLSPFPLALPTEQVITTCWCWAKTFPHPPRGFPPKHFSYLQICVWGSNSYFVISFERPLVLSIWSWATQVSFHSWLAFYLLQQRWLGYFSSWGMDFLLHLVPTTLPSRFLLAPRHTSPCLAVPIRFLEYPLFSFLFTNPFLHEYFPKVFSFLFGSLHFLNASFIHTHTHTHIYMHARTHTHSHSEPSLVADFMFLNLSIP